MRYLQIIQIICAKCVHNFNITFFGRLLGAAITPENSIRKQDMKSIITTMTDASLIGANEILDYLDTNYDEILKM